MSRLYGKPGRVHPFGILLNHTTRAKARHGRADRLSYLLEPAHWYSIRVAIVKGWDHLFFKESVECFRVGCVHGGGIVPCHAPIDQPAIRSRVTFRPPTVPRAQVKRAIDRRFHPAGPAPRGRLSRRL